MEGAALTDQRICRSPQHCVFGTAAVAIIVLPLLSHVHTRALTRKHTLANTPERTRADHQVLKSLRVDERLDDLGAIRSRLAQYANVKIDKCWKVLQHEIAASCRAVPIRFGVRCAASSL